MNKHIFTNEKFVGYISKVTPSFSNIHFPTPKLLKKFWHYDDELSGGIVGNYVVIEGENYGFLGKLQEISLPEKEQNFLGEHAFYDSSFHPQGKVELLLSFNYYSTKIDKGLDKYPAVGSKVYLCSADLIKTLFVSDTSDSSITFDIAKLTNTLETSLPLNPNQLFGRHCAVVGTTGGGKSYTVSRILEEFLELNQSKAILIDATGEYENFYELDNVKTVKFGSNNEDTFFHYSRLRTMDLVSIFKPSEGVQKPRLLDAIKSLKLVKQLELNEGYGQNTYPKAGQPKSNYENALNKYRKEVESDKSDFKINNLCPQIYAECVKASATNSFGDEDKTAKNHVNPLINRIERIKGQKEFKNIFGFDKQLDDENEFNQQLEDFLDEAQTEQTLFIISLKDAPFENGLREILTNAIGSYLLDEARDYKFKKNPIVLFIDEAHQFLKKTINDDTIQDLELDAFDKIAKECRKHGLFLCISTQNPKDIPVGTLSQMGTFIVHRLINESDRAVIEKACSEGSKNSLSYLPTLQSGEALLISIEMPMPIIIKIKEPNIKPTSLTPKLFNGS
ncbi:MAG: ATP-binding protein [Halarcobacter sp.]